MGKILLVEDDNNLREIYGARLLAEGYEIVSANDGEEALAIAVKEKPDLIIADVMMPRISGFDMLDILRNAPETKNTKIIMMTALSQQEDKEHAEKLGADKYLVKSQVTLEDVAQVVREILGESKGSQDKPDEPTPPKDTPEDNKPKDDEPPTGNTPPSTPPPPSPDKPVSSPPANPLSDTPPPAAEQKPAETSGSAPAIPTTPEQPAESSSTPSQAGPQPNKPEPTPSAPPAQQPPSGPQSNQVGDSTLPSAPVSNDATTPSNASDNNSPVKSSSISIPVVEPPADKPEENAQPAEQKPESTQSPPQQTTPQSPPASSPPTTPPADDTNTNDTADTADKKDESDKIGPNLAQALAEEEKQVKEQINNFENKITGDNEPAKKPDTGDNDQQPNVISPTQPQDSSQSTPEDVKDTPKDEGNNPEQKSESSDDSPEKDSLNPKKKVIQPINDLSKKPDLAAMAAEEEKTAKVINQNVIAPESKPVDNNTKSDSKTSPHDISI
jgi:CheY-like chemotaxis protein